jgi:hypothetical protein
MAEVGGGGNGDAVHQPGESNARDSNVSARNVGAAIELDADFDDDFDAATWAIDDDWSICGQQWLFQGVQIVYTSPFLRPIRGCNNPPLEKKGGRGPLTPLAPSHNYFPRGGFQGVS